MVDLGLVNFPIKIDTKMILILENNINKLFESNSKVAATASPDRIVIRHEALHIQYEQIKLDDKFRQYFETSLISEKIFRTGIKNTISKILRTKNRPTSL